MSIVPLRIESESRILFNTARKIERHVEFIQNLLSNRRFYVVLNNERYTNDQLVHDETRSFIYADVLCITAPYPTFSQIENTIEEEPGELTEYHRDTHIVC